MSSNYMYRLLVIALLIGTIPVIIVGFISYWIASKDIEDKVKDAKIQMLKQDQMRVEQIIKNLEVSALQYAGSSLVIEAIREQLTYTDHRKIWDLSKGLYNLQASDGIKEVYLINFKDKWIIRNSGFYPLNQFEYTEEMIYVTTQNPKKMFWVLAENPLSSDTVNLIVKLPLYFNSNNVDGILIIEMFKDELFQSILDNHSMVINSDDEAIIMETDNDNVPIDIDELRPLLSSSNGFVRMQMNGEEWGVSYIKSAYNELTYISFASMTEIKKQSRKIAVITLITCLILFLLVAIAAFYGSRKMYSPIRRLFQYTENGKDYDETTSSRDEFSMIEERFRTMFHTEKKLQLQVKEQFPRMRELLVLQLFMEHYSPVDWLYKCRMLGFSIKWKYYAVIVLQIDTLSATKYFESDRDLLLYAINNIAEDIVQDNNWFKPVLLDQHQVTIMYCDKSHLDEANTYFYDMAVQLKSKVAEFLNVQVSIGISSSFESITNAKAAYKEGLEALQSRFVLGNDIIIHFDDIRSKQEFENKTYTDLKALESQVLLAFKPTDQRKVEEAFQKYLQVIMHKQLSFKEYQVLMGQLLTKLLELIQEYGVSSTEVLGETVFQNEWRQLSQTEEICKWFGVHVFTPIIEFLSAREQFKFTNVANEMLKIVRDQYDRDISLEYCGDLLNYHPVYLSRVFKKEMGLNFTEYVAQFRMDQAKVWLEQTDMMVSEIAEKLTYQNTTAFIRTFRKIIGLTPGKYRTQYKKN